MSRNYDLDELLAFAQRGDSALSIIETLGLRITERRVQQLIRLHLGPRPSSKSIARPDVLRERVVAHLQAQGKDPRKFSECGRFTLRGGAIRAVNRDPSFDSLVFVCFKCAAPGDV